MKERVAELKDRLKEALTLRELKSIELAKALNIPESSISQYLTGVSKRMPPERFETICEYLKVSEPWMLGYDVPMERMAQKKKDTLDDVVQRMKTDADFYFVVASELGLNKKQLTSVRNLLIAFSEESHNNFE